MEGRAQAARQDYELALAQAWHGEVFAREKRLKKLKEYLPRKTSAATGEDILNGMMRMQAAGVPMNIRRLN
jgi:hypothetical protein